MNRPGGAARLLVVLSVAMGSVLAGISAQQAPAPTGAITGRIVDADTGAAVPGASVLYQAYGLPQSRQSTTAGSDGRFSFEGLGQGSYIVSASASGYSTGWYGAIRPGEPATLPMILQRNQRADIAIRMWRNGVVSGTVLEQDGQPAVGLRMMTLSRRSGAWSSLGRGAVTDDRGEYRIGDLPPGRYLIFAPGSYAGPTGQTQKLAQPVFYPNASTSVAAIPVDVRAGQEAGGIEMRINVSGAVGRRVSGLVSGPGANVDGMDVMLLPSDMAAAQYDLRTTRTDQAGRFTFGGVSAGAYRLVVAAFPDWPDDATLGNRMVATFTPPGRLVFGTTTRATLAEQRYDTAMPSAIPPVPTWAALAEVTIEDRDLVDVELRLAPGARIRGKVIFDGAKPPSGQDLLSRVALVVPTDGQHLPNVPQGRLEADGTFRTVGLPPGLYGVDVQSPFEGWTLASITRDGRNIAGLPIDLGATDVNDLVLTYTDKTTAAQGTLRDTQSRPLPGRRVYIFPQEPLRRVPRASFHGVPLVQQTVSSPSGAFEFRQLLAGDYLISYSANPPEDWTSPEFLRSLESTSTPFRLNLGEIRTIDVRATAER